MGNSDSTLQIIPFYSHPHVHTVIRDHTQYDETTYSAVVNDQLPYSTAIVIGADQGIDNRWVRLTSVDVKNKIFGVTNFAKYGQPSLQADVLFNGNTNVWLMRVLPDNAKYANIVVLAHYRKGKILDDLGQETGKVRLEIKFSIVYAADPYLTTGARTDKEIEAFANSLKTDTADPLTGYMTMPIMYAHAIGHGKYGNNYSLSIHRDPDAEKEYDMKMYRFDLIDNTNTTSILNQFSGSIHVSANHNVSTIIDDVVNQYSLGSCPINMHSFEDNVIELYEFYRGIIKENLKYIQNSGSNKEDVEELKIAQGITMDSFDPFFGIMLNDQNGETIPYYRNYTAPTGSAYVAPDLEIPNTAGATKPLNISDWATAAIGSRVLVVADPLNEGHRWIYTVTSIDDEGNILYDDGEETSIDADQYDGINLSQSIGYSFNGGSDGDFDEITVGETTRKPNTAEMKLLLAREYVKAFRGIKDRRILSPARIDIDMLFDANYNLTTEETLNISTNMATLYDSSTVLTDKDAATLTTLISSTEAISYGDLNVKQAMYDLNEFRNRNGMTMNMEQGAGASLYLDCGLVGMKNIGVNTELDTIISSMEKFTGRQTSVDLGYYEIYDPQSKRKVEVTVGYHLAKNLIPHLVEYGLNKPFVFNHSSLIAMQQSSEDRSIIPGQMIRDSFQPDIDLIDWDVKERLYKSRINYYLVTSEGRIVQRACQNTRQLEASALLEENNVRVLNRLKKGLETACRGYLYEWNDPTVRKGYTEAQMKIYKPWIGTIVEDLNIYFKANEFEQNRMMMHCYCDVKFRDIVKRIILEINIYRPDGMAD